MKIIFVLSGLSAGGAEKVVNELGHHRLALGDQVTVAAFSGHPASSFLRYDDKISLRCLNEQTHDTSQFLRFIRRIKFVRALVKELQPDVIVSFLTKVNLAVLVATLGGKVPVVVSERNNPVLQNKSIVVPTLMRALYPIATRVVMQTRGANNILPRRILSKSAVIPNAVAPIEVPRAPENLCKQVVAVGRLTHQKGFDLLIEAFRRVLGHVPEAKLVIYGDGQDREKLQNQIVVLKLEDHVRLAGLSRAPMSWVEDGQVFVLSSRYEGFPNVLLEAMNAGLATVAFDCDWGPSDVIENEVDGLLVPNGDVAAMSLALERVLTDAGLRNNLARRARIKSQAFSLKTVFKQWDDVIEGSAAIK